LATKALRPLDEDEDIQQDESVQYGDKKEDKKPDPDADPLEGKENLQKALLSLYLKCCEEERYPRLMEIMA
jgi:hypothetical protein